MSKAIVLSKQYREFRERCGIKDPVMLGEIEEAYFEGYDEAEKELIEKSIEFLKDHLEGYDIFGSDIERSVESFKLAMKDE